MFIPQIQCLTYACTCIYMCMTVIQISTCLSFFPLMQPYHIVPAALNAYHNVLLRNIMKNNDWSITINNHPLPRTLETQVTPHILHTDHCLQHSGVALIAHSTIQCCKHSSCTSQTYVCTFLCSPISILYKRISNTFL